MSSFVVVDALYDLLFDILLTGVVVLNVYRAHYIYLVLYSCNRAIMLTDQFV